MSCPFYVQLYCCLWKSIQIQCLGYKCPLPALYITKKYPTPTLHQVSVFTLSNFAVTKWICKKCFQSSPKQYPALRSVNLYTIRFFFCFYISYRQWWLVTDQSVTWRSRVLGVWRHLSWLSVRSAPVGCKCLAQLQTSFTQWLQLRSLDAWFLWS